MNVLSGLSKAAVAVTAATVLGSTLAVTGAILSGPARAAAVIDTSSQSAFLRSIAPLAQEGQRSYRVPASVAMAQAILESGWGKSTLTTRGNAFFGIKCSTVMGLYATGCLNMRTREVFNGTPTYIMDGFRTYDDPVDSFKDHGRFLTVNSRYRAAFNYPNDPKRFVAEVHRAGYATDPTYTAMVVRLMDQFNLYRYDTRPAATASASMTPSRTPSAVLTVTAAVDPTVTASAVPTVTAPVASSARPSSSPSATSTPELPQVVPSTLEPTRTPDAVINEPDPLPTAGTGRVPYAIPTPSDSSSALLPASSTTLTATASSAATTATASSRVITSPTATAASRVITSPTATAASRVITSPTAIAASRVITSSTATASSRVITSPAASMSSRVTRRAAASAIVPIPNVTPSVEALENQPSVGDGVVPDPSMEPEARSSEDLSSLTESAPAKSVETAQVDPPDVRATEPQDQSKAGALFPDGAQVTVTGVRQKERYGGLAKTGS